MKYGDMQARVAVYAKHVSTIFYRTRSELFRVCPFMDIVDINRWLLFVLWRTISINFEFESHSTAYISVIKPVFHLAEFCARSGLFLCLLISLLELIRKDKEKFRCARKIPPNGKPA
jgi:hypothetical protein